MTWLRNPLDQLKRLLPPLVGSYALILLFIGLTAYVSHQRGIPVSDFTRDPAAVADKSPFLGLLSNVGILFWCGTAAVCFLVAAVMRKNGVRPRTWYWFFLISGIGTTALLLDDLFLLHEVVYPRLLGIPETVTFFFYGTGTLLYLAAYRRLIARSESVLLLLALGFFALSLFVDAITSQTEELVFLLEDSLKLFGIVTWCMYFVRASLQKLDFRIDARLHLQPSEGQELAGTDALQETPAAAQLSTDHPIHPAPQ